MFFGTSPQHQRALPVIDTASMAEFMPNPSHWFRVWVSGWYGWSKRINMCIICGLVGPHVWPGAIATSHRFHTMRSELIGRPWYTVYLFLTDFMDHTNFVAHLPSTRQIFLSNSATASSQWNTCNAVMAGPCWVCKHLGTWKYHLWYTSEQPTGLCQRPFSRTPSSHGVPEGWHMQTHADTYYSMSWQGKQNDFKLAPMNKKGLASFQRFKAASQTPIRIEENVVK